MINNLLNLIGSHPGKALFGFLAFCYGAYVIWKLWIGAYTTTTMGVPTLATQAKAHILIWTLVPPAWFFFEAYILSSNQDLQALKQGQELASKFWAGMLAAMLFLKPR